jgi:hypothetical protein
MQDDFRIKKLLSVCNCQLIVDEISRSDLPVVSARNCEVDCNRHTVDHWSYLVYGQDKRIKYL